MAMGSVRQKNNNETDECPVKDRVLPGETRNRNRDSYTELPGQEVGR